MGRFRYAPGGLAAIPFRVRLGYARELVARAESARACLPLHIVDQLEAATAETARFVPVIGRGLQLLEPDRGWHQRVEVATAEKASYLLAALMVCLDRPCVHLRRGGPQPAFARLPLRRVDCRRCSATVVRPPSGDADVCDVCGVRQPDVWFVPFTISAGAAVVMGDACRACSTVLGIGERERAS